MESDGEYNWPAWYNHQKIEIRNRELRNKRAIGDYAHYSFVEIGQNTEKSPGDPRKVTVIQIPVENHQPIPV